MKSTDPTPALVKWPAPPILPSPIQNVSARTSQSGLIKADEREKAHCDHTGPRSKP